MRTNRKRKIRAVKEEATRLCSRIVRATRGPMCEAKCGKPAKDHAHIVGRNYSHTRSDETNGLALCGTCHYEFDNNLSFRMGLVNLTVGMAEYERLFAKARAGVDVKFDWFDELDRLKALWDQIEGRAA